MSNVPLKMKRTWIVTGTFLLVFPSANSWMSDHSGIISNSLQHATLQHHRTKIISNAPPPSNGKRSWNNRKALWLRNNEDDDKDSAEIQIDLSIETETTADRTSSYDDKVETPPVPSSNLTPSFPFLTAAMATMVFVLFWPLLAFVQNSYFDVDMFMSLKGILDDTSMDENSIIVELPPLSPAERLVDAIFGPP
ncbi:hypothetical protein IV203_012037 [Nitzschia inconspicua]|uniref:Uncharacterized protein n=1 Tax=Nitzschia inconspicua TaxID=303405 RepID=A0A9K3KUH6_9STRA|nr:hypothetical protein IV203_012037 [Nitzschia inconspicua]